MMTFVKCYNELSKFYKTEEGQLFLNYENAKRLLNLYCNYQELQFYKKNESELGLLPRMIELEAKVSQKRLKIIYLPKLKQMLKV
ncbi:MAG: hypothetical protein M0D57_00235 [Sphingobacteriales bacterium JAD_PAG50586_3]|nr:MAG: hypothetical protein M0D57_00235 [Sphingobacteriales bacterium JAD_PAG50586_3]